MECTTNFQLSKVQIYIWIVQDTPSRAPGPQEGPKRVTCLLSSFGRYSFFRPSFLRPSIRSPVLCITYVFCPFCRFFGFD